MRPTQTRHGDFQAPESCGKTPDNQNSYCLDMKDQEQLYFRALPDKSHLTLAPCAGQAGATN